MTFAIYHKKEDGFLNLISDATTKNVSFYCWGEFKVRNDDKAFEPFTYTCREELASKVGLERSKSVVLDIAARATGVEADANWLVAVPLTLWNEPLWEEAVGLLELVE